MGGGGARLVRAPVADNRSADYQAGANCLCLGHTDGRLYAQRIHAVDGADNVPAISLEALGYILGEGNIGFPLDRYIIVIVKIDNLAQAQRASQRRSLRGNAFLYIAIGDDGIGIVIDYLVSRPIVILCQPSLSYSHAYTVGESLSQRPCRRLNTWGEPELRVTWSFASPLPKLPDVV